jgi:hypothetical protein
MNYSSKNASNRCFKCIPILVQRASRWSKNVAEKGIWGHASSPTHATVSSSLTCRCHLCHSPEEPAASSPTPPLASADDLLALEPLDPSREGEGRKEADHVSPCVVPLHGALGLVLAKGISALDPLPPFRTSIKVPASPSPFRLSWRNLRCVMPVFLFS